MCKPTCILTIEHFYQPQLSAQQIYTLKLTQHANYNTKHRRIYFPSSFYQSIFFPNNSKRIERNFVNNLVYTCVFAFYAFPGTSDRIVSGLCKCLKSGLDRYLIRCFVFDLFLFQLLEGILKEIVSTILCM